MRFSVPIRSKVTPEMKAALDAMGAADDRTTSYLVRQAVREYIERHQHYNQDELKSSYYMRPETIVDTREATCVENWPDCYNGGYDPRCCRFPKSCSVRGDVSLASVLPS